jgi:hypothetical protein
MRTVSSVSTQSDPTIFYGARVGTAYFPPAAGIGTPGSSLDASFSNGTASLDFSHWGKDPLTPGFATPDLDVHGSISLVEDLQNGVLTLTGSFVGDTFPSAEAFIKDQSGVQVFLGAKREQGNILSLYGDNRKPLFNVNMQIMFDNKGNFPGVRYDGQVYTVDEWNKRVQEGF